MERHFVKVAPHVLDLPEPDQDLQEALFSLDEDTVLKLDRNEATISPSPTVIKTLLHTLESGSLNHQADWRARALRRQLALYSGANFDSISCFSNSLAALESIARTYLHAGVEALAGWPAQSLIARCAAGTGAKVKSIRMRDPYEWSLEEITSAITPRTRLIYFANPNEITGAHLTEAELVFLLSYAENSLVVIDEPYFEYCGVTMADLVSRFSNLAVIRSFANAFAMAGIDSAYLLTDPGNLKFINRVAVGKEPGALAQIAAQAALEDTGYTAGYVQQIHESKKMLFETLPRLGYDFRITLANYFLLKVRKPESLISTLAKNNIFIKSLSEIELFENHVRISIGTLSQTGVLLDILGRVAQNQAMPREDYAVQPAINRLKVVDLETADVAVKKDALTYVSK